MTGMPQKHKGDKAKINDAKNTGPGSSIFTEPKSGIRIV